MNSDTRKCWRTMIAASGLAIVGFALGGCTAYRALPLDPSTVEAALRPQPLAAVRTAVAKIDHPLLKPLAINGQGGFTPDEIALMAVIVSPQLRTLRDQRGLAAAQLLQAGILPNPQFGFTTDIPHGNADPTYVAARSLGLTWDVTSLLTHHDHVAAARAAAGALDLDVAWAEWQIAEDARLRAFRVLSLEHRVPLAREIEADLAETRELMRKAVALGQRTSGDLAAADATWSAAQTARFGLDQDLANERNALNLTLGAPAGHPVQLKPAADFPALSEDTASADRLLDGLENRRLDLVALRLGYESQEASLRAAVLAQFPKIALSFSKARDTSDVKTLGYGVAIDVPLFDRNQGPIAIGRATRQQLFDDYIARVAEARATVVRILSNLANTRAQLAALDVRLPPLEQRAARLRQELAEHQTDVLACREARGSVLALRIERAGLRQTLLELGVALEIATGRPLLNRSPSS